MFEVCLVNYFMTNTKNYKTNLVEYITFSDFDVSWYSTCPWMEDSRPKAFQATCGQSLWKAISVLVSVVLRKTIDVDFFCVGVKYSGEYDVCDVTLSVYPHRASLKNMPGHGGNRTYDLWNTSLMLAGSAAVILGRLFVRFAYLWSGSFGHFICGRLFTLTLFIVLKLSTHNFHTTKHSVISPFTLILYFGNSISESPFHWIGFELRQHQCACYYYLLTNIVQS
jgi:hypothetical protein